VSTRLATAIAEATARAPGLSMRRGTVLNATTVQVHDGTHLAVIWWVGTPIAGKPCLLLALRGSYVGLPLINTSTTREEG
jgi:hypothetical protein